MILIVVYLLNYTLPINKNEASRVRRHTCSFYLIEGKLYQTGSYSPLLIGYTKAEGNNVLINSRRNHWITPRGATLSKVSLKDQILLALE